MALRRTVAISSALNFANVGIVNGIDATGIAIDREYHVWAISNGTTDGVLASLSSSAPTAERLYVEDFRIGALMRPACQSQSCMVPTRAQGSVYPRTSWGHAQHEYDPVAWADQPERPVSLVDLGRETLLDLGSVPTTASHIHLLVNSNYKTGGASVINVAPSQTYSGTNNGAIGSNGRDAALLEQRSIFGRHVLDDAGDYGSILATGAAGTVGVLGWEDQI
jgi:hypothetical protein